MTPWLQAVRDSKLPPHARVILYVISFFISDSGFSDGSASKFPNVEILSFWTGMSYVEVHVWLNVLDAFGFITLNPDTYEYVVHLNGPIDRQGT